jgi:hypothetical protein
MTEKQEIELANVGDDNQVAPSDTKVAPAEIDGAAAEEG